MSVEIERKFLVKGDGWREKSNGIFYRQGYLSLKKEHVVRIRVVGEKAFLTVKSTSKWASRMEFEYPIPLQDAEYMLNHLCEKPLIEKKRYTFESGGMTWEVDEFFNENAGLILAEVELTSEDQSLELPSWIGREVTGDSRFYNSSLIRKPYSKWTDDSRQSSVDSR
ncbi:MAG: adenylate cyclase [Candidatus Marinimicrobia bacterium]|jgi:CYTH domain-containing protein|nr:adenylate cyclase [Candidatus Neomarinimicrobiota bacterium]